MIQPRVRKPDTGDNDAEVPFAETDDPADETPAASEPCLNSGHGKDAGAVSDFDPDPCPENGQSRVRNPDTNLVREPLSKPVKEEEDAQARDSDFDRFFEELLSALGFAANATLPAWWQGWPAGSHVRRWIDELGLSRIGSSRSRPRPAVITPTRPMAPRRSTGSWNALPGAMLQATLPMPAKPSAAARPRQPPPSPDELAAFYAAMVNSDDYLPPSMISNRMCEVMLARGLVTPERLRMRGVL